MRILLAHRFWSLTGGAEVFFRGTERILREAGHETLMIATGDVAADAPDNLILLEGADFSRGPLPMRALKLPAAIYDRDKKKRFAEAIEAFRPDVMHVFGLSAYLSLSPIDAAAEAGLPIVASFNDYKHICPNHKLFANGAVCMACKGRRFHNAVVRRCCKDSLGLSVAAMLEAQAHARRGLYEKIDRFTFASNFMARTTQEFWPERELHWSKLRNPFDSTAYSASDDYEPFALYFGRLIAEKGVDRLLDAARDVEGYPIKIVGDGPDEARLRERARTEGLTNVEFLGPLWGSELDPILLRAAFVVVPSLWPENFPYVINQSFALARPVIGSGRGGIPELVEHGVRGLVFEPDRPGELAMAMRSLANDPQRARAMGRAAKEWSDIEFNDAAFLASLQRAYERATDTRRNRRR